MQRPCTLLFSDRRNQSRLGPTDRGRPLGRDQETNGESKVGRTSQTTILGTVPCTPVEIVLCNLPDINSVVGADIFLYSIVGTINSHTVRPPTCLWASIVLWAPGFTVPGERGETPHMPQGINSICRYGHLLFLKKANTTSHMHLTFYSTSTML